MTTADERSPAAVRAARYRRHRKGDHSMCLVGRCDEAEDQPEAEAAPEFGPAGQLIWDGTLKFGALTEAQRSLLRQVCRMADRMDELHQDIEDNRDDLGTVKWMMREFRQSAIAMKNIVGELRMSGVAGGNASEKSGAKDEDGDTSVPSGKGPGIADITQRIAAKIAQAQG